MFKSDEQVYNIFTALFKRDNPTLTELFLLKPICQSKISQLLIARILNQVFIDFNFTRWNRP
jgi:hypothetical protein